jgi:hypothetical protein
MNGLDVLAARAAVSTWQGEEGALSQEIRRSDRLTIAILASWLARWGVARNVPKGNRELFLDFMNDKAIPAYRGIKSVSGEAAYEIVDELSQSTTPISPADQRPICCGA